MGVHGQKCVFVRACMRVCMCACAYVLCHYQLLRTINGTPRNPLGKFSTRSVRMSMYVSVYL